MSRKKTASSQERVAKQVALWIMFVFFFCDSIECTWYTQSIGQFRVTQCFPLQFNLISNLKQCIIFRTWKTTKIVIYSYFFSRTHTRNIVLFVSWFIHRRFVWFSVRCTVHNVKLSMDRQMSNERENIWNGISWHNTLHPIFLYIDFESALQKQLSMLRMDCITRRRNRMKGRET